VANEQIVVQQEFVLVTPPPPTHDEYKTTIMNRNVEFNISKYVREGWMFFKYNFCQFFGIGLFFVLVSIAFDVAFVYTVGRHHWNDRGEYAYDWNVRNALISAGFLAFRGLLFTFPLFASMYKAVFNAMRNNTKIRFLDFFSCYTCPYWFRLMGLGTVMVIVSVIPLFFWLFGIVAFYFLLVTVFAIPMHVEHSFIGLWTSLYYSFKVFHRYWCSMLAFLFLLAVMQVLGLLCFGVGLFVTIPVGFLSLCYCYHHLVGVNGVAVLVPVAHLEGMPAAEVPSVATPVTAIAMPAEAVATPIA